MFTINVLDGPLKGRLINVEKTQPELHFPDTFRPVIHVYKLSGYCDYLFVRTDEIKQAGDHGKV